MVIEKEQYPYSINTSCIRRAFRQDIWEWCNHVFGPYQGNDKWSWGDDIVKFSTIHCAEFFAWRWYGYDVD
jgi:hypothetical protein